MCVQLHPIANSLLHTRCHHSLKAVFHLLQGGFLPPSNVPITWLDRAYILSPPPGGASLFWVMIHSCQVAGDNLKH